MTRLWLAAVLTFAVSAANAEQFLTPPWAVPNQAPPSGSVFAPGAVQDCLTANGLAVACPFSDLVPQVDNTKPFLPATPDQRARVVTISPNSGATNQYPAGAIPITGNATGTTSAVVGTLKALAGTTTYICGFNVSAIGGTAAVGPITIAGLVGSSMVYQLASATAGNMVTQTFTPCIPASGLNTAITITTTADGTASAVDVNSWGYQK